MMMMTMEEGCSIEVGDEKGCRNERRRGESRYTRIELTNIACGLGNLVGKGAGVGWILDIGFVKCKMWGGEV